MDPNPLLAPKPQPPLRTLDEARAAVAALAAGAIQKSADELRAHLDKAIDTTTNEYQNGVTMLRAADEFVLGAHASIKALQKPRLLRPDRGIRVVGKS